MVPRYTKKNLPAYCDAVAMQDGDLKKILDTHGYPPLWVRTNTFDMLVLIILEQQVSLASAYAAFKKLQEKIHITPENLLLLTDDELRACYFSRQKIGYVRGLATAILSGELNLKNLNRLSDDAVRARLKKLKGIGDWTVDIYLIHSLQRCDIFPIGDLALVNAMKGVKGLPTSTPKEELVQLAEAWRPYRTFATLILWHQYIQMRGIKLLH